MKAHPFLLAHLGSAYISKKKHFQLVCVMPNWDISPVQQDGVDGHAAQKSQEPTPDCLTTDFSVSQGLLTLDTLHPMGTLS